MKNLIYFSVLSVLLFSCGKTHDFSSTSMAEAESYAALTPFNQPGENYIYNTQFTLPLQSFVLEEMNAFNSGDLEEYEVSDFQITHASIWPTSNAYNMAELDSVIIAVGDFVNQDYVIVYEDKYISLGIPNVPFGLNLDRADFLDRDLTELYNKYHDFDCIIRLIPKNTNSTTQALKATLSFSFTIDGSYKD